MARIAVKLSLRVAWWLRWYLAGASPDMTKVERWIRRGLSVRAIRSP